MCEVFLGMWGKSEETDYVFGLNVAPYDWLRWAHWSSKSEHFLGYIPDAVRYLVFPYARWI